LIDGIAVQTNFLALNAAVETARSAAGVMALSTATAGGNDRAMV
jgi:hypothetical protein